jgi:hypothetical protein
MRGSSLSQGIATQLITAAATLAGVFLTLITNSYLDHRRSKDTRSLEILRLDSEHNKWLMDQRMHSYSDYLLVGEDVFHFFQSELPRITQADTQQRNKAEMRWRDLSIQLRKAYNEVLLFGSEETRPLARKLWRTAWHEGNDFFRDLADETIPREDLLKRMLDIANDSGDSGNRLIELFRREFQTRSDA